MRLEEFGFKKISKPTIIVEPKLQKIIFNNINLPANYCAVYIKQENDEIKLGFDFNEKDFEIKENELIVPGISEYFSKRMETNRIVTTFFDEKIIIAVFKVKKENKLEVKKPSASYEVKIQKKTKRIYIMKEHLTETEKEILNRYEEYLKSKGIAQSSITFLYLPQAKFALKANISIDATRRDIEEIVNKYYGTVKRKDNIKYGILKFLRWRTKEWLKANRILFEEYIRHKYPEVAKFIDIDSFINKIYMTIGEMRESDGLVPSIVVEFYDKVKSGEIYSEISMKSTDHEYVRILERTIE